jgi:hypothetical protein
LPVSLFCTILIAAACAIAQVELVADNFFPAALEFPELLKIASEESFADSTRLAKVESGSLFSDVGFTKYQRRIYSMEASGELSIEVVTLQDDRAAFSLLTLLRDSSVQDGPPGDGFNASANYICFAQGRQWVRIQGRGASGDLLKRVAVSVSNRIGPQRQKPPSLVSHFPRLGYDASSLRYFVGLKSFKSYSSAAPDGYAQFTSDMELAQARYTIQDQTGILSLSIFPTAQVAEDYFAELPNLQSAKESGNKTYAKRSGPLIAILEGSFDPGSADRILASLQYSYSIRWIYEKPKPKIIWGVPSAILGTVVSSLLFVALLCGASILVGAGYAVFRFLLRGHAPENPLDRPERTEIIRLRLR